MSLHIANGRLIDPAAGVDRRADLYIVDGHVAAVDVAPAGFRADRRIEADGLAVLPGLVDLCARVANPDASPSPDAQRAALAAGVTRLVQPPDGGVMLDDPARVHAFLNESPAGPCRIHAVGALTPGLRGEALAELRLLAQAGCLAFGQGEAGLSDTRLLWNAMRYAAGAGLALWLRPQDPWLARGASAAGGAYAARLGLEGLPDLAETVSLQTLFELQRDTGARLHLSRLSSAAGLARVRAAKREGLPVSCDVSANHLHLTDVDIGFFDARYRLLPPLRGQRDRDAIRAALADGTVDALCSDHTAVTAAGKAAPYAEAQPGAPGLATLLPLTLKWARDQRVPLAEALARVTSGPAAVLRAVAPQAPSGMALAGTLAPGAPADLCLVDLDAEQAPDSAMLPCGSALSPFAGMMLPGRVRVTVVGGSLAWETPA
ncbi:MAG: dihydroorotase [Achromobacter sp.]|nr:dihydroorotase [Achromobacter sp.]